MLFGQTLKGTGLNNGSNPCKNGKLVNKILIGDQAAEEEIHECWRSCACN
jgi:hypothetical protein